MPAYNPLAGDMNIMLPRSPVRESMNNGSGAAAKVMDSARSTMQGNLATSRNVALILALSMGIVFALHYTGFRGTVTIGAR